MHATFHFVGHQQRERRELLKGDEKCKVLSPTGHLDKIHLVVSQSCECPVFCSFRHTDLSARSHSPSCCWCRNTCLITRCLFQKKLKHRWMHFVTFCSLTPDSFKEVSAGPSVVLTFKSNQKDNEKVGISLLERNMIEMNCLDDCEHHSQLSKTMREKLWKLINSQKGEKEKQKLHFNRQLKFSQ